LLEFLSEVALVGAQLQVLWHRDFAYILGGCKLAPIDARLLLVAFASTEVQAAWELLLVGAGRS